MKRYLFIFYYDFQSINALFCKDKISQAEFRLCDKGELKIIDITNPSSLLEYYRGAWVAVSNDI